MKNLVPLMVCSFLTAELAEESEKTVIVFLN